jgi:hypothetical protein
MTAGATSEPGVSEDRFLAIVEAVCAANGSLTPLSGALLAGPHLGMPSDTRSIARILGVEHALVLRDLTTLSEGTTLIRITARNGKTQRTAYELTAAGSALVVLAISNLARATQDSTH